MLEFIQLTSSVYAHMFGETVGNVSFIKTNQGLIFVDSGMYPSIAKAAREKAELITHQKVTHLIITHYHSDHVLGNQAFRDCVIVSSNDTLELMVKLKNEHFTPDQIMETINENNELKEKWKDLEIILPNMNFRTKFVMEVGDKELQIFQTGGHTRGSSFIFVPSDKVVIAGDLLFSGMYPYGGDETADIFLWIEALNKILSLKPKLIVPGHGNATSEVEVKKHRDYFIDLAKYVSDKIKENLSPSDILTQSDLPPFPYKINSERLKSMIYQIYKTIKNK